MRFTQYTLAAAIFCAGTAVALPRNNNSDDLDDISNDDVPGECRQVCEPVLSLTDDCNRNSPDDDDDVAFRTCACTATDAQNLLADCETCVRNFDDNNGDDDDDDDDDDDSNDNNDNDFLDLIQACGFSTRAYSGMTVLPISLPTSGVPASTPTTVGPAPTSAAPTPTGTGDGDDDDNDDDDDDDDDDNNNNNTGTGATGPFATGTGSAPMGTGAAAGMKPRVWGPVAGLGGMAVFAVGMM